MRAVADLRLKKDVKYSSKLYVLCEKLRENGAMNIETLNTELYLAEKKKTINVL